MIKRNKKILLLIPLVELLIGFIYFSSATWGWLSGRIDSTSNVISSSTFDINVFVKNDAGDDKYIEIDSNNEYGYLVHLDSKGIYTVTITINDQSTAKNGYCKIVANKESHLAQSYYKVVMQQGEINDILTFTIETLQDDVNLLFIPSMGMSTVNSFEADEGYLAINFQDK